MEKNKKISIIVIIIIIIAASIGISYYIIQNSQIEMKNQTFDDVTLSVPLDSIFTKNKGDSYQNQNRSIIIGTMDKTTFNSFSSMALENTSFKKISIENLRADAESYSDTKNIIVIIPNSDKTRYASISIENNSQDTEKVAVLMSNSLFFNHQNNNENNITSQSNETRGSKLIGETAAYNIVKNNHGDNFNVSKNVNLYNENGREVYLVYIKDGEGIWTVEVDAYTGNIIS